MREERVAATFELAAKLAVVVDLAVADEPDLAVGASQRLMPACEVGCFCTSKFGSSNAPLKKGTGSWQPAHQREACTLPSRFSPTSRVSFTLKR